MEKIKEKITTEKMVISTKTIATMYGRTWEDVTDDREEQVRLLGKPFVELVRKDIPQDMWWLMSTEIGEVWYDYAIGAVVLFDKNGTAWESMV